MTKIIVNCLTGEHTVEELTADEQAQRTLDATNDTARLEAEATAKAEKDNLKASAKAKLIAGEALTEDEANTIVL